MDFMIAFGRRLKSPFYLCVAEVSTRLDGESPVKRLCRRVCLQVVPTLYIA